ncbi:nuclear transport factor 2 family protein [Mycoplana sp. MJR14]|uniref:YybH family protein n=1 Tax=Mycoplana sp. MJR14 TaxID=3032583 RepID=UPI0023DC4598|nr:nuclear transport factor 2 family protein [Mycoplana sp. MJR14]MDF1632059.1 nuclear transport factor 2 family protein [Mycoplana sp. MJR14]
MTQKLTLASTPDGIVPALLAHLNSLDVETMLGFYDPDGMIIDAGGRPHVGRAAIGAELARYFALGLQMSITQRHMSSPATSPRSFSTGPTSAPPATAPRSTWWRPPPTSPAAARTGCGAT